MIIIPDRQMPKTCAECPCLDHQLRYCRARADGYWTVPQTYIARPKWCPLKEVKKA